MLVAIIVVVSTGVLSAQPAPPAGAAPSQQAQAAPSSQVVHLLSNHSVVIRTESRLKQIIIGNPGVITTVTTAPDELVLSAKEPGTSSLVLQLENGETRLIEVFSDVDVTTLRDAIARAFPGANVQVEADEGKLVLFGSVANQAMLDQLLKMAAPFAKEIVNSVQLPPLPRQKQILLKVRFAEVDRSRLAQFGFNLFSLGATNTIGTASTQQFIPPTLGGGSSQGGGITSSHNGVSTTMTLTDLLNIFVYRPDLNLGATLRDLQQKNILQILAEPNLLAANGETARFLAGGEFPYPVVSTGNGGVPTISIQFRDYGVKLEFTGHIQDDGSIRLKIVPEVSSLDYSNSITLAGFVMPAISTRRAETVVELKDGQSFGIAGLIDQRVTEQLSKVPGIGDIPILGQLFRSRSMNKSTTELLVLVTPTIVDPVNAQPAGQAAPTMPIAPLDVPQFDKGKK